MMNIGSESGVRTGEFAPLITARFWSFRGSCEATPTSVSIRLSACSRYGMSAFGGRGPVYLSAARPDAHTRTNNAANSENTRMVYTTSSGPATFPCSDLSGCPAPRVFLYGASYPHADTAG